MKLDGKVAIVTGSGQGVGRGIGLALAAEGARVVLMSRTASRVEAVASEIHDRGGEALAITGDVTRPRDIESTLSTTLETYERLEAGFLRLLTKKLKRRGNRVRLPPSGS